jgi:hypothetical protein
VRRYRDPLLPGVVQKVARLSLVLQYDDGYTAVVLGEDLYATATFPLVFPLETDVEVQAVRDLSLLPSVFETKKLVLEVTLLHPERRSQPALRVQCAFPDEEPPIPRE